MASENPKKPWYKKWWAITLFILIILGFVGSFFEDNNANSINQQGKTLNEYSVNELKDECVSLCLGGDNTPYMKVECENYCNQLYYYGGKDSLIKEINDSLTSKFNDKNSQIISIVGSSKIQTINNLNEIISMELTGSSNQISVTKETKILSIKIVGSNNIINLCKIHSPKIEDIGSYNLINYLDC
ncbi:MAG: hypothetical protein AABX68_01980 [Nanoarchaeota archaeon]